MAIEGDAHTIPILLCESSFKSRATIFTCFVEEWEIADVRLWVVCNSAKDAGNLARGSAGGTPAGQPPGRRRYNRGPAYEAACI
jgi:hypothetical protein